MSGPSTLGRFGNGLSRSSSPGFFWPGLPSTLRAARWEIIAVCFGKRPGARCFSRARAFARLGRENHLALAHHAVALGDHQLGAGQPAADLDDLSVVLAEGDHCRPDLSLRRVVL